MAAPTWSRWHICWHNICCRIICLGQNGRHREVDERLMEAEAETRLQPISWRSCSHETTIQLIQDESHLQSSQEQLEIRRRLGSGATRTGYGHGGDFIVVRNPATTVDGSFVLRRSGELFDGAPPVPRRHERRNRIDQFRPRGWSPTSLFVLDGIFIRLGRGCGRDLEMCYSTRQRRAGSTRASHVSVVRSLSMIPLLVSDPQQRPKKFND